MVCISASIKKIASKVLEKTPIAIFTDIGKDTDDSLALTYAVAKGLNVFEVIITSENPAESAAIARNLLDSLGSKDVPVTLGSKKTLKGKKFDKNIYKGSFCESKSKFKDFDPENMEKCIAIIIGPVTDALKAIKAGKVSKTFFMGQTNGKGMPDDKAYNFRCDMDASNEYFDESEDTPIFLVGKEQAYKVPLKKPYFEELEKTGHPAGKFLKDHAFQSFDHIKESLPEVYERAYKGTDNISYCYDPLTIAAYAIPGLVDYKKSGKADMAKDIKSEKAKKEIFETVLSFLKKQ